MFTVSALPIPVDCPSEIEVALLQEIVIPARI